MELNNNEENMKIYNAVRSVPKEAQKPISAGRLKGMTDISPQWRIEKLTEVFGPVGIGWFTEEIKREFVQGANDEMMCFIDIKLYVKINNEWSKPIFGTGGSTFIAKESKGLYTSDEVVKMAYTDAISVACKQLGFGADIYWNKNDSKYQSNTSKQVENKNVEMITDAQVTKLHTIFSKIENGESVKKQLYDKFNVKTSKQLTKKNANTMIDFLEKKFGGSNER